MARDIYRALAETEYIADPNRRMRKITEATGWDKILQAAGIPLEKVEVTRDLQVIFNEMERDYKRKKSRYVDKLVGIVNGVVDDLSKEKVPTPSEIFSKVVTPMVPVIKDAYEEGIVIELGDIGEELIKKGQPQLGRAFLTMPVPLRGKALDILTKMEKIHRMLGIKSSKLEE